MCRHTNSRRFFNGHRTKGDRRKVEAEDMSKVKDHNFYTVQAFMVKDLKLKGLEKDIYAIIFGFSQLEGQVFNGSLQYLADWTCSTKQGVSKVLKTLVEKGLIVKKDKFINGVKFCEYYTTEFNTLLNNVDRGMQQSLIPGMQQSLTNNISLDNTDNNIVNSIGEKKERKAAKQTSYDDIINENVYSEEVKAALYEFIKMRKLIKKPLTDYALKRLIKKLLKLSEGDIEKAIKILDTSTMNNWQDIYELKVEKPAANNYRSSANNGNVFLDIAKEEGLY